ncbi:MAG: LysR family transcriptional regulator [Solirubrobacterales bacterium]|nr:LysR family transcriptional regulator [Solirubrobacterales bacterium]
MTLRQVAYFLTVTDEGSFTLAARKLRIAQPSLSQQIQALERDLGADLLERTSRGARLTPEGREFLPEARAMLAAAQRARLAVRRTAELETGELEIATVRSLAVGVLPGLIGEFRGRHPGVRIWLREFAHRDELNDAVMSGMSDLAVGPRPGTWPGPVLGLGWEEFVVILPPEDPAAQEGDSINLRGLADREWILYQPGHGLDDVVLFACAQAGFTPRPAMRTGQAEAAVRLAASGLGVAMVPINVVPEHLAGTLRHLRPPVVRELAAYARTEFAPAAEAFVAAVTARYGPPRPPRSIVFR